MTDGRCRTCRFHRAHWQPGWLVRIEDDCDGHRFAFAFCGRETQPANVLTQVVAQNAAVFLAESETLRAFRG